MRCRAAFAMVILALSGTAAAAQGLPFLPGYRGTPQEQRACDPDVQRYCRSFIPDTMQILACLQRNRTRIAPPCQMVLKSNGQ